MSSPADASAGSAGRPAPARPRARALLLFVVVGALLGALAGSGVALLQAQVYSANAVISVAPPSQILDDERSRDDDDSTAMVQSELIVLSGPTLRSDIQRLAGPGAPVSFSAAQVGTSTIVNIDVEAATATRALEGAEAVVAAYSANRSERLRREVERAAGVVDSELSRLERDLEGETIGAAALQQEYGRLLAVRSGLFRAAANADQAVTVVQPPVLSGDGLSGVSRYGGLGALLGALVGAGLLMLITRRRRGVRTWDDVGGAGVAVLQPEVVAFHGPIRDFTGHTAAAGDMRLLVSQLVPTGDSGLLVLFGATPRVGASFAAAAAAVCLSERSDVLLVLAADVVEDRDGTGAVELGAVGAPAGLSTLPDAPLSADDVLAASTPTGVSGVSVLARGPGPTDAVLLRRLFRNGLVDACVATGRTVVVDAPALCDSTTTVDLAERAGGAALVVGRAVTTRSDVETVRQTFHRQQITLLGAVVNRPSRVAEPVTPGPASRGRGDDGADRSATAAGSRGSASRRDGRGAAAPGDGSAPARLADRRPSEDSPSAPPAPAPVRDLHAAVGPTTAGDPAAATVQEQPSELRPDDGVPASAEEASPLEHDWPWKDDQPAEPTFAALVTDPPSPEPGPQATGADPVAPTAGGPVAQTAEGSIAESAEEPVPAAEGSIAESAQEPVPAAEEPVPTAEEPVPTAETVAEPADPVPTVDAAPAPEDAPVGWPTGAADTSSGSALIGWPTGETVPADPSPSRGWFSHPKP